MIETLSTSTRALLKAAREEGPSAEANAKIWSGVAGVAGVAGAAGASSAPLAGPFVSGAVKLMAGKTMAIGALFGSAVTVGIAMIVLHVGPAPAPSPDHARAPRAQRAQTASVAEGATNIVTEPREAPRPIEPESASPSELAPEPVLARSRGTPAPPVATAVNDPLLRESMLVAEAREALARGDAEAALVAIHATRLAARALEPEELSIESRALRSVGREDESMAIDLRLKTQFPGHALAR